MGWREGGFNFGEAYGFKALHFENKKPQMNPCERRFEATGNTDDADLADFHGYEIVRIRVIRTIRIPSEAPDNYNNLTIKIRRRLRSHRVFQSEASITRNG